MPYPHKSDSSEQRQAENDIFSLVQQELGIALKQCEKLPLSHNGSYIQPDFYSKDPLIIGEIFSHVGKPKKAQDNKIANDILKMLVYEKITGVKHQKIIAVCDKEEYDKLKGSSALAEAIRQFEIDLMLVTIPDALRHKLISAQERQRMINE